jgi:hypothetical protein
MVGILQEQHAHHIVLSDSTCMPLAEGLILERDSGTPITIIYNRIRGGAMVVQSIQRGAAPNDSFR